MQTIYTFSYTPAIATGTNTIGVNWRMAYQQPIMLYKGTANTIKIVVFATNQRVVNLTGYQIQVQIVDKETEEHYVTRTAIIANPTSGVGTITFTEAELRNLENRFYHIIARLVLPSDGSSVTTSEILYLDDNYGAFLPIQIENAWNYQPTIISTENGAQVINFRSIGETPDSYTGNAGKLLQVNSLENAIEFTNNISAINIGDLSFSNSTISTNLLDINFSFGTQKISFVDNSVDPNHNFGDGGFITFNDNTHTDDGPRFEIWYGNVSEPADPAGQHSLDIRAAANSYVELASHDLNSFIGVDDVGPFIQTQWQTNPSKSWRFLGDGELRLPTSGSRITSEDNKLKITMTYDDIRLTTTDLDGSTQHTTIFDATGNVFFDGDLLPGFFTPDPTPLHSLGSNTHPWKDMHLDNLTISNSTIDPSNGNLLLSGNFVPTADNAYDLGSPANQWRHLYVANGSIYIDNIKLSNQNGKLSITTVINPGEENEEPDPEDSNATSNITSSLVNGEHEFKLESDGTLTLDGETFTGGGGTIGPVQPYVELTNDAIIWEPYAGPLVTFTKDDYATGAEARDEVDTGLAIARNNNQGIYNPYLEPDWDNTSSDGPSPAGTLWNKDGWTDLTNLDQRIYFSFYDTFLRFGNNVLNAEAIMKDVANNKYYKFDFIIWGNANQGAPLAYIRTRLDPVTGDPIGEPVTFSKAGYADPTQVNDPIDTNLTIARANNQSIYNIALETGYSTVGDGEDSPEGTLWNDSGWNNFRDVASRSYDTFKNVLGAIGNNILNKELVMHDTINDKYYAVKFSQWTQNNQGGGFSYTRQLINTNQYFVKTDNGEEVDILIPDDGDGAGVGITRGSYYGIYNPYREGSWDENVSPGGTLWNIDGWDDLSNVVDRTYQPLYAAFGEGGLGNKIVGTPCVMYLPDNNKYYLVKFLSWTQGGNGGGFSYEKYELDLTKVNEGIRFADGTILKSAAGVGRVKSTASGGRRIEEICGNKIVAVTPVITTNLSTVASRAGSGTNQIWIDSTTTTIDDIINNSGAYGITDSQTIQFSLDNTTWYTFSGGTSYIGNERGHSIFGNVTYNQGDTIYFRYKTGGDPQVWWNKDDLPGGGANFRGAVIDYHAYSGQATWIGTIHIVSDSGEEHITHTEVMSGSTDGENDDLWLVQNEGTISYRRIDGEAKTLKVHWTAKVFYGSEYYD